jgi:hypothetical protein
VQYLHVKCHFILTAFVNIDKQTIWLTIKINKIDAAYEHTPINSFDYQYSEQITHIRLYLKLVLTYVHFGENGRVVTIAV